MKKTIMKPLKPLLRIVRIVKQIRSRRRKANTIWYLKLKTQLMLSLSKRRLRLLSLTKILNLSLRFQKLRQRVAETRMKIL